MATSYELLHPTFEETKRTLCQVLHDRAKTSVGTVQFLHDGSAQLFWSWVCLISKIRQPATPTSKTGPEKKNNKTQPSEKEALSTGQEMILARKGINTHAHDCVANY